MEKHYTLIDYLKKDGVYDLYITQLPTNIRQEVSNILAKPILIWLKNHRLRKVSSEVKISEKTITNLRTASTRILDFLSYFPIIWANPLGVSLPQLGITKRVIIVNFNKDLIKLVSGEICRKGNMCDTCMLNPEIIEIMDPEDIQEWRESCLSLPWIAGRVPRYQKLKIGFTNLQWIKNIREISWINAIIFQHELDHLNGILYPDKAKKLIRIDYNTNIITPITYKELENLY